MVERSSRVACVQRSYFAVELGDWVFVEEFSAAIERESGFVAEALEEEFPHHIGSVVRFARDSGASYCFSLLH